MSQLKISFVCAYFPLENLLGVRQMRIAYFPQQCECMQVKGGLTHSADCYKSDKVYRK